jgi:protein gp37
MYRGASGIFAFDAHTVTQTSTKSGGAFNLPLRLKEPQKVFVSSLSDFFHKDWDGFRDQVWDIIRRTPHLTYQILTKRPQNIASRLPADWGEGWDNVWLGTSIGFQHTADKRIPQLISVPAKTRFLSAEPLLENVELLHHLAPGHIHWVIIGGESGNENGFYRYRPCELQWIDNIVEDCRANGVACWVKQLGTDLRHRLRLTDRHGANPAEWPARFRVQQFPSLVL